MQKKRNKKRINKIYKDFICNRNYNAFNYNFHFGKNVHWKKEEQNNSNKS